LTYFEAIEHSFATLAMLIIETSQVFCNSPKNISNKFKIFLFSASAKASD